MLKDRFVNIDGVVLNTDHVKSVESDGEGGVRVYTTFVNESDPARNAYWAYEGELAEKILAFFRANATNI